MRLIPISVVILTLTLTSCSMAKVYKEEIVQGNRLIQDQIERIEVGMTRDQIKFLLGSPVTVSTFNPNRWIYLERIVFNGEIRQNKYLILIFERDRVSEIQRESGGSPLDPLSKVDTAQPDHPNEGSSWWPF